MIINVIFIFNTLASNENCSNDIYVSSWPTKDKFSKFTFTERSPEILNVYTCIFNSDKHYVLILNYYLLLCLNKWLLLSGMIKLSIVNDFNSPFISVTKFSFTSTIVNSSKWIFIFYTDLFKQLKNVYKYDYKNCFINLWYQWWNK